MDKKFINKILTEGAIKDYLATEAEFYSKNLTNPNDFRSGFSAWKSKVATSVEIVSYKTLDIADEITNALKSIKPQKKGCFTTAWKVVSYIDGVDYVEGIGSYMIPIDHAWNCYRGQHFDLTAEILFNSKMLDEYEQLIYLEPDEVFFYMSELEISGPYALAYFLRNVKNKWDEKTIDMLKRMF